MAGPLSTSMPIFFAIGLNIHQVTHPELPAYGLTH
jgi:hypothetical protein